MPQFFRGQKARPAMSSACPSTMIVGPLLRHAHAIFHVCVYVCAHTFGNVQDVEAHILY